MKKQNSNCCFGCEDRHVGRHGSCEDYQKYRKELDEKKERINKEVTNHSDWWAHKKQQIERVKKRNKEK